MRYVKYIGQTHQRMITAQEWRSVGITADTMVWNAGNGFAVPLDLFTESMLRKAIEPDAFFVVTGDDAEFVPVYQPGNMTPAEHRQAIESPVDVLALLNEVPAPNGGRGEDQFPQVADQVEDIDEDSQTNQDRLP